MNCFWSSNINERLKCLVILGIILKDLNLNKECYNVWE